jgi:hypothetical protein
VWIGLSETNSTHRRRRINTSSINFFHPTLLLTYTTVHQYSCRWVRSYLERCLGLGEDNRHSVLENSPLSCHFTTRDEEFFKIGAVCFECLASFLRQGVEGGLEDVALVEVGSVVAGVSTLHA